MNANRLRILSALALTGLLAGCTVQTAWDASPASSSAASSAAPSPAASAAAAAPTKPPLAASKPPVSAKPPEPSRKPAASPSAVATPSAATATTPAATAAATPSPTSAHSAAPTAQKTAAPSASAKPSSSEEKKTLSWYYMKKGPGKVPGFPAETAKYGPDRRAVYVGTGRKVYLTFDTGGPMGDTAKLLKALRDNGVKANFFLAGYNLKKYPDFVKQLVADGDLVANHTMTHTDMTTQTDAEVEKEVRDYELLFEKTTGQPMTRIFRFPYGKYNLHLLEKLTSMGYTSVFWSTAMRDWEPRKNGADDAYRDVMNGLHDGNIILMHQGSEDNINALDRIIKGIKAKGYEFALLTDFLS
ncbi:polysaccharide deacetylase family protein [Gorillibacterium sp. sgz500922]|uniref:polysaccharide deacetylase family protein n=1 Tax=Gorillibacterium sp. sgz500922 TaxID=3446694 RepID=UPI003F66ECFF